MNWRFMPLMIVVIISTGTRQFPCPLFLCMRRMAFRGATTESGLASGLERDRGLM